MLLAIETAYTACSVALIEGGVVRVSQHEEIGRGHAERLVSMIAQVLAEAGGLTPTSIVVDVGPGSFTGVRIGLAAARALGFAWGCAVDGVASDALVARALFAREDTPDNLLVVLDALRGELFVREWTRSGPLGPARTATPEMAGAQARAIGAAAGNGLSLLDDFPSWTALLGPSAAAVVHLVSQDRTTPVPLYIRAPDAKPSG